MTMGPGDLAADVRRIATEALRVARGTDQEAAVEVAQRRLDEPLRVAIAGRVKAGKSTLLNALVGERLAATDAGECTKIVTWYRNALGYRVVAELRPSGRRELTFRRQDGALEIDLGDLDVAAVDRLEVGWPSQKLVDLTLIDTPGLASATEGTSERTTAALLDDEGDGPGDADAVLYLMRHLHRSDVQFLEAFVDRSVAHASPINAIVVLSRADEIGAARPDALDSARAVATRYAADDRVRELASGVVPVAGLIAETGATLREAQFGWLRTVAALPEARRDFLLLSADRFRDPDQNPLGEEIREELLARLGMFGLRLAVQLVADGRVSTSTELSSALLERSGIRELQRMLTERYGRRAQALKARSALAALRVIGEELDRRGVAGASDIVVSVDRLEASSQDLALLRLLHLVLTGAVELTAAERAEVDRLCGAAPAGERVGIGAEATASQVRAAALDAIERWRSRAASPLSDRRTIEAAEIVSRAYEGIYAAAG
jgi:energy-coupling factor transporter ATP-binding protein EcfA2